jgi:hypothetical protein
MNIVVLSPDIPYPPNRGGRADIWRRIEAFRALGHRVALVYLYDPVPHGPPSEAVLAKIGEVVEVREGFPIQRGLGRTLRQLAGSRRVPWHAATRVPGPAERTRIVASLRAFAPQLLWLDGPWFGELARDLAREFSIPYAYRSANIEFQYLRGQARVAARARDRLAWRLACVGLERYELDLMRGARAVLDISMDDLAYWQGRGVERLRWLPPLPQHDAATATGEAVPSDLLFIGNLRTPNNLQGLRWLVDEVMPRVRSRGAPLTLTVVGSQPDASVRDWLAARAEVATRFDVPDTQPHRDGARVLVNPVGVGSGVQVKMLDMLMTDTPLVTRAQGLRGLPASFRALADVADTPDAFADAIVRQWHVPVVDREARARARALFSDIRLGEILAELEIPAHVR